MPARASKNAAGGKTVSLTKEEVMSKVIALRKAEQKRKLSKEYIAKKTVQQVRDDPDLMAMLGDFKVKREVTEMEPDGVMRSIAKAILAVTRSILSGEGFKYMVPSRSSSNTKYIDAVGRIVMGEMETERAFADTKQVRKAAIMTRVMGLIHELCKAGIHSTKRDIFYTDVKLFVKQDESDAVLNDVAAMVGCTRNSLNVVASDKGVVIGKLQFREDGDLIDCSKMGIGGKAIPASVDKITDITGDAQFILLVEKDAAFMRLAEDRFYNDYPCAIITAKGQPDVGTRLFLKQVVDKLAIPVMALMDADPYGLKILSVYTSGSQNMAYDSLNLTTPNIHWLGVRPSDLEKYNIPEACRLPMTADDIKTGRKMLTEDYILQNPEWAKELETMVRTKEKAEIQSLSSFGFQYLTKQYLPQKLANGDWLSQT